jgi:hypothetical protein
MHETPFSALSALRSLRDQLIVRLEANEEYRVLRALDSALAQVTRLPPALNPSQIPLTSARSLQDDLASRVQPATHTPESADEEPMIFAKVS